MYQIYINTNTSFQFKKTIVLDVYKTTKINQIKELIFKKTLIPTKYQRLVFKNKDLHGDSNLNENYVNKEDTIHLKYRFLRK